MTVHRPDPETDPFRPPAIPTEVFCLHCQEEYESYLMEWHEEAVKGKRQGFWCCPTHGCDGKGFGFDIFPIDPEYRDENGEPVGPFSDADDDSDDLGDEPGGEWAVLDEGQPWGEPIDSDALLDERENDATASQDEMPPDLPPIELDPDRPRPRRDRSRWDDDLPW